jgi:hypothetical protein
VTMMVGLMLSWSVLEPNTKTAEFVENFKRSDLFTPQEQIEGQCYLIIIDGEPTIEDAKLCDYRY